MEIYYVSMANHNVECYKCHDYGHMERKCRKNMAKYTTQKVIEVWRRKLKDSLGEQPKIEA